VRLERECPARPLTEGVPDDGMHCECWYEGLGCCRCADGEVRPGRRRWMVPAALTLIWFVTIVVLAWVAA